MKKALKYTILSLLILLNRNIDGQIPFDSEISVLTCSSGEELYSLFGHTAIRVKHNEQNIDYVFNYGTFNFNTPNFYLKFMRGELDYILSVTTFDRFIREYEYDKRSVLEQKLLLTEDERNDIIEALVINSLPENKAYRYHFFYDNCATRVRDIVGMQLSDYPNFKALSDSLEGFTYRDGIAIYLARKEWTKFGLDLILGAPTDDLLDKNSIQFLPDFLYNQFQTAVKCDSTLLVDESIVLLDFPIVSQNSIVKPIHLTLFVLILIISVSIYEYKKGKYYMLVDYILYIPAVFLGLLILFLWFFTSHSVTGPNWHILWANPLFIFFLFNTKNKIVKYITLLPALSVVVLPLIIPFIQQKISYILLPIWISMMIRIVIYFKRKNIFNNHI